MSGQPPTCASCLRVGAGVGAGEHDGARSSLEDERLVLGLGRHVGLADAATALVERSGCLVLGLGLDRRPVGVVVGRRLELGRGHAHPRGQLSRQRLAVRQVQVHGTRRARARAEGGGERLVGERAQHRRSARASPSASIASGTGRSASSRTVGANMPGLAGGLVGADAAQLGRPVGGQQQQRHAGVMRLERGRQQVRDRGARRADHGRRHPCLASDAERREAGDALVDAHVQADRAAPLEFGGDEGERLRPRTGAQHDVPDARARRAGTAAPRRRRSRARSRARPRRGACRSRQPTAPR